jgi:hypothetical protein
MLGGMAGEVRPYRASDRERALELLGDTRALDSPSSRVHVLEDEGVVSGAAVLVLPDAGDEAYLGTISLASPGDLSATYALAAACALEALDAGFRRGRFTLLDHRLLDLLRRDFTIDARPSGWDPVTAATHQWDVTVDLEDALAQLERVGATDG